MPISSTLLRIAAGQHLSYSIYLRASIYRQIENLIGVPQSLTRAFVPPRRSGNEIGYSSVASARDFPLDLGNLWCAY